MGGYCFVISDYFTTTKYYSVNGFAMIGVWAIIATPKYKLNDNYYTLAGFKRGYELITITKDKYEKLNPDDRHYETKSYSYEW
ncbi:hypothetical protein [Campylobacter vicugnae]|uniref:hypothetical protein n=1 Tax=Campylobacter vicugnae TaxID=1660076 RepID=UPI0030D513F3